jgi:hypothetical protein
MHVTYLDDQSSPLKVSSASPFRHKEWRNLVLATGAPGRRSEQRHQPADSQRASDNPGRGM